MVSHTTITQKDYYAHGIVLYVAWFLLGMVSLASKRYFKAPFMAMHIVHVLTGFAIVIMTTVMCLIMLGKYEWKVVSDFHQVTGVITFITHFATLGLGLARIIIAKRTPEPWSKNDKAVLVGKIHRWAGYIILLIANLACFGGVIHYLKDVRKNNKALPLAILTLPLFALIVAILEVNKRLINRLKALDFGDTNPLPLLSLDLFQHFTSSEKKPLTIVDNLVLNMGEFNLMHPGGRFVIDKANGRDSSKYFYGGYAMLGLP